MIPNLVNLGLVSRTEDGRIDLTKHGTVYANDLYVKYLTLYKFLKKNSTAAMKTRGRTLYAVFALSRTKTQIR